MAQLNRRFPLECLSSDLQLEARSIQKSVDVTGNMDVGTNAPNLQGNLYLVPMPAANRRSINRKIISNSCNLKFA